MTDATLLISLQLSDHLFEELAMDVYDEVDRRETDAGEMIINTMERTDSGNVHSTSANFRCIWCSLAGHSEPQHLGNGDNSCAFPSCKPRVLINSKPGKFSTESWYAFTKVFLTGNKDIALRHVKFYNTF